MFEEFWRQGLLAYDELQGIEWEWLACDGAMGKAPLGGEQTGPNPTDRAKKGRSDRSSARARASRSGSRSRARTVNDFKLLPRDARVDPDRAAGRRPPSSRRVSASTRATTTRRCYELCAEFGLHRPHPRPRRREQAIKRRGRLPRPPLGRRAHPLLAGAAARHRSRRSRAPRGEARRRRDDVACPSGALG